MGRKKKSDAISLPVDMVEEYYIEPSMWCDRDERQAAIVACLYRCSDKAKCAIYAKRYDFILDMDIQEKYLLKYGLPEYTVPDRIAKQAKREAKEAKEQEKLAKRNARQKKADAKEQALLEKVAKKKAKETIKKIDEAVEVAAKPVAKSKKVKPKTTKSVKKPVKKNDKTIDLTGEW